MRYRISLIKLIRTWLVVCPDGDIYFENSLEDAFARTNIHAMNKAVAA